MAQHGVTGVVAHGVVDRLEAVEIGKDDDPALVVAARGGQEPAQLLIEPSAIEKPGQGIPRRQGFKIDDSLALGAELALQVRNHPYQPVD